MNKPVTPWTYGLLVGILIGVLFGFVVGYESCRMIIAYQMSRIQKSHMETMKSILKDIDKEEQ